MGDKIEARRAMQAAGLPVLPGSESAIESEAEGIETGARNRLPGDSQGICGRRWTRDAHRSY